MLSISSWNIAENREWFVRLGESSTSVPFSGKMLKRTDPETGKLTKDNIEFDISFADSSTLPPSQQATYDKVAWLMGNGVITPEDVLKYKLVDIPHADEILADRQAQMQQAPPDGMPPQGALPPGMEQMMGGMPPQMPPMGVGPMAPPQGGMGLGPTDMAPDPNMVGEVAMQFAAETGLPIEQVLALLQGG